jgi:hypothetical protein
MFVDQSGFYLLPSVVVRTYAPVGQRHPSSTRSSRARSPLGHERYNPGGKAADARAGESFQGRGRGLLASRSTPSARYLASSADRLGRGSPIHRSKAVKKEFMKGGAAERIRLEELPGYAPDLTTLTKVSGST